MTLPDLSTAETVEAEFDRLRSLLPEGTPGEAWLLIWQLERRMVLRTVAAEVLAQHAQRDRHLRPVP